jgi:membrane-anchored protein YejM (alkaline phosphatase superfamily)
MKVSTKSWHYKFCQFMYDWEEFYDLRRLANFEYAMSKTTKCNYWLRVTGNLLFAVVAVTLVILFTIAIILSGVWIPVLIVIGFIYCVIGACRLYSDYNSRCDKIEFVDPDQQQ